MPGLTRIGLFVLLCSCFAFWKVSYGQGGPPMITDDPGTPGNQKWEINLATAFEHRPGETSFDLPAIDLNYGVGEHIQLTLQTASVLLKESGHGVIGGLGGTEAAIKWRFLDQETTGLDMSMFPRVIFNILQSSVRRGLAEDGTRFQIPFQIAKEFGRWSADLELGPLASTVGRSEWLYGIAARLEMTKATALMAELHGSARTNFGRDVLTANIGLTHEFSESRILLLSLGHELRDPDQARSMIGYLGMQLLY